MEFSVSYDKRSLTSAATALFFDRWYPLFPGVSLSITTVTLVVGVISFFLSGFVATTAIFLSLGVLNAVTPLVVFAQHRHRILKLLGKAARIELDERFVRVDSVLGTGEVPWNSIIKMDKGADNVLLFVSRGAAIVIPTASIPPAALDILELKRQELASPETRSRRTE